MDMQWQSRSKSYGMDNAILKSYIDSMLGDDINVYIQELDIGGEAKHWDSVQDNKLIQPLRKENKSRVYIS